MAVGMVGQRAVPLGGLMAATSAALLAGPLVYAAGRWAGPWAGRMAVARAGPWVLPTAGPSVASRAGGMAGKSVVRMADLLDAS